MSTILHYLPHFIFSGLALLALWAMFGDDSRKKRTAPELPRHRHYQWTDHDSRRG